MGRAVNQVVAVVGAVAISGVGVALVVIAYHMGGLGGCTPRRAPGWDTRVTLAKTGTLLGLWRERFGRFPPDDLSALAREVGWDASLVEGANPLNVGAEAVVLAFRREGFGIDPEWGEFQLGNWDEDALSRPLVGMRERQLTEVLDRWGNPLVYIRADAYERCAQEGVRILTHMLDEVVAHPRRTASGGFERPDTFQLFSLGEDGEPNTEDDLVFDGR